MARLTDADRAQIIASLQAGESQNGIARRLGCSPSSVNRVAHAAGLEYSAAKNERHSTVAAVAAHVTYSRERRLVLLDAGFAKAEGLLGGIEKPRDLQFWATSVGILIDKRRLEDESTEVAGGEILALVEQMRADVQPPDGETGPEHSGE